VADEDREQGKGGPRPRFSSSGRKRLRVSRGSTSRAASSSSGSKRRPTGDSSLARRETSTRKGIRSASAVWLPGFGRSCVVRLVLFATRINKLQKLYLETTHDEQTYKISNVHVFRQQTTNRILKIVIRKTKTGAPRARTAGSWGASPAVRRASP